MGLFACSYCLTLKAAKTLLKENYPMVTPADFWSRWDKYGIIELYQSDIRVCWHNNAASGFTSGIAESNFKQVETVVLSLFRKLCYKVTRLIGVVIDKVWMFMRIYKI